MSPSLGSSITLYASPQKPGVLFGHILAGKPWFEFERLGCQNTRTKKGNYQDRLARADRNCGRGMRRSANWKPTGLLAFARSSVAHCKRIDRIGLREWSGHGDSNTGPPAPKAGALPG